MEAPLFFAKICKVNFIDDEDHLEKLKKDVSTANQQVFGERSIFLNDLFWLTN